MDRPGEPLILRVFPLWLTEEGLEQGTHLPLLWHLYVPLGCSVLEIQKKHHICPLNVFSINIPSPYTLMEMSCNARHSPRTWPCFWKKSRCHTSHTQDLHSCDQWGSQQSSPPPQSFIFYSGDLSNPCSLNQAHGMLSIMAVLYNSSQT